MSGFTLFISDLHLQEEMPEITERFIDFLKNQAIHADALYILGDLFEAWIGDDDRTFYHENICTLLRNLSQHGVAIYFMRGNRDFMVGKQFAARCGITLLPDPYLLKIYGLPITLSHGDHLCTLDTRHQKYRRIVLQPFFQKTMLLMPLAFRRKIAEKLRRKSKHHYRYTTPEIGDVTPHAVENLVHEKKSGLLIHGHTHKPNVHDTTLGKRIVLGAWHDNADYVRLFSNGSWELKPLTR